MSVEIKFTCNICFIVYIRDDGKSKMPVGWGAIRPTLRVNMPPWAKCDTKEKEEQWEKLSATREALKQKLYKKEYHLCQDCLNLSQDKILRIESGKKAT